MKKFLTLIVLLAFVFCAMSAHADDRDLTHKRIGELETYSGTTASGDLTLIYDASDGNVKTVDARAGLTQSGDSTFRTNLLATGRKGGVSTLSSSSTQLNPSTLPYTIWIKQAGGNNSLDETDGGTRLTDGTAGQIAIFYLLGVMTDGSWIITPDTATTFDSVTLDTAGENITLLFVDSTVGWIIVGNEGGTVDASSIFDAWNFQADEG